MKPLSVTQLLQTSKRLRTLAKKHNDILEMDKLIKSAVIELFPDSEKFIANFRVVNVKTNEITLAASSSAWYMAIYYRSPDLAKLLGKRIKVKILHYDGKTTVEPKLIALE